MPKTLNIGSRGSKLALWQAEWVKKALGAHHPTLACQIVIIKTTGDKILDVPLARVGGKGLFVKEIEEALGAGRIDLAVHSMKDMPAQVPADLRIGAVPEREAPQDVLISRAGLPLADLPPGAIIGTSSLRRAAQLRHARPDLVIQALRGNLDTRLRKLDTEALAAIVLAAAGVRRLGFQARISQVLDESLMLPAVGQGALCIEIRKKDTDTARLVAKLDHGPTRISVTAERAFLHHLEGGCQVPIAGHAKIDGQRLTLAGLVAEPDGSRVLRETVSGPAQEPEKLGLQLAERLLTLGAGGILEKLKSDA
jgi:hydroxymethylbilane synthase